MKNKEVKGILALVVVTALSFGVIAGSRALSTDIAGNTGTGEAAAALEEYDVSGSETVEKAVRTESGYEVTVRESGYASDIVLRVAFESDASTISSVEVLEQNETESLGSRIAEPEFLDQFKGVAAPVYLPGMTQAPQKMQHPKPKKLLRRNPWKRWKAPLFQTAHTPLPVSRIPTVIQIRCPSRWKMVRLPL